MNRYFLKVKMDGTIEFWTNDDELRTRVEQNIKDIVDAMNFRRQITKVNAVIEGDEE